MGGSSSLMNEGVDDDGVGYAPHILRRSTMTLPCGRNKISYLSLFMSAYWKKSVGNLSKT